MMITKEPRNHINAQFDAELRALKDQIRAMGNLVDAHVTMAVEALLARDAGLARSVMEADRAVNQMELAIDEQCVRMLALRQPAASDLRFIAAALKMVTDLERIGDLSVNMGERAITLAAEPPLAAVADLPAMAEAAQQMLRDVLDAFVTGDAVKAERVIAADAEVDAMTLRLFPLIKAEMAKDPANIDRGVATIFFAKHLERMADHATNVAEMIVYLVRGHDVRHARSV
jgi:phosphate transport system protein